jgi:hypothetical protein
MERRDNELTPNTDPADDWLRELLGIHGEPQQLAPPPWLAARINAHLPDESPMDTAFRERRRHVRRRLGVSAAAALLVALVALGSWGIFANSSGPAELIGTVVGGVGRAVLVATLAAKPLVDLLITSGVTTLVLLLLAASAGTWGWWRLVRRPTGLAEALP